jgi:beta-glucosidase
MRASLSGWFDFPLKNYSAYDTGIYADFVGLSYCARRVVSGFKGGGFSEICPAGIVKCAKQLYDFLPLPIYITENGNQYIHEHLKVLAESDLPVERYYHYNE